MNKRQDFANEITKVLILSYCENEWGGRGETAQDILSFEQKAFDAYLGKTTDPTSVVFNRLHARVNRDVALIVQALDQFGLREVA